MTSIVSAFLEIKSDMGKGISTRPMLYHSVWRLVWIYQLHVILLDLDLQSDFLSCLLSVFLSDWFLIRFEFSIIMPRFFPPSLTGLISKFIWQISIPNVAEMMSTLLLLQLYLASHPNSRKSSLSSVIVTRCSETWWCKDISRYGYYCVLQVSSTPPPKEPP